MLTERIAQAHHSFLGKWLLSVSERIGGPASLSFLNLICTAALGFAVTYPLYELGGIVAAFPTGAFTLALLAIIALSILNHLAGGPLSGPNMRKLLTFGILFSLPFGLLSLNLLHFMEAEEERNRGRR